MAYATLAEVRALEGMVGETTAYPDALIDEAILFADLLIDRFTGTSWDGKSFNVTLDGSGNSRLTLIDPYDGRRILFPRTISSCTIDSVAQTTTDWALFPEGYVLRDEGTFTYTFPGQNVVIAGTAGATTSAPDDIAFASRTIARQYCLDRTSRVDDRAFLITNDLGTLRLSVPGDQYPTGMPAVDAVLRRRRHRGPSVA